MRSLFTCLVFLGLLAGLPGNVLVADPCERLVDMHMEEHRDHDHGPAHPCDPSHDQECPSEHHHHDACCHTMPLAAEEPASSYMGGYGFTLMPVRSESLRLPVGPFADMDKPPLI